MISPSNREEELAEINNSIDEEEFKEDTSGGQNVLDIIINNVVCSFSVNRQLDLKELACNACNVEYKKSDGKVHMRLKPQAPDEPYVTASIWKSGKVTCTGATSEDWALVTAKRVGNILAKLYPAIASKEKKQKRKEKRQIKSISNYRVVNVLGTCRMPFAIKIDRFTTRYGKSSERNPNVPYAEYEPELHPGVTARYINPKATLKIFSTGSVTITAPSTKTINYVIHEIYPRLKDFQRKRNEGDINAMRKQRKGKFQDSTCDCYLQEVNKIEELSDSESWSHW